MNERILHVPLDDRPYTYLLPEKTARLTKTQVISPPPALLGKFKKPGNADEILDWMNSLEDRFDGVIISIDMILYGGLVASRTLQTTEDKAKERLDRLFQILTDKKEALGTVYLFSALLRTAPTYIDESQVSLAEKLIQFSCESYHAAKGNKESLKIIEHIKKSISPERLDQYIAVRNRNHSLNKYLLSLAKDDNIDYLHIGIDDSKTVGLNILEKEELESIIAANNLNNKVSIAPGTDEASLMLLARLLCSFSTFTPSFYPLYSNSDGKKIIGRYEDRSIEEIVNLHIKIIGGDLSSSRSKADIMFYIHTPSFRQKEACFQKLELMRLLESSAIDNFVRSIKKSIKKGRFTALADVFYANGSDQKLMNSIFDACSTLSLAGYAGWNTAGNTIGTAAAHSLIFFLAVKTAKEEELSSIFQIQGELLLERYADDWLYQSIIRQELSAEALAKRVSVFHLDHRREEFEELAFTRLKDSLKKLLNRLKGEKAGLVDSPYASDFLHPVEMEITLPWGRLFEVSINFFR